MNLERAMKAGDRVDGHIVQGHVEDTGRIMNYELRIMNDGLLTIEVSDTLISSIQAKGSIAIDGVSLTVVAIEGDTVSVALIPLTMKETTLGSLTKGAKVNIETDILRRFARE